MINLINPIFTCCGESPFLQGTGHIVEFYASDEHPLVSKFCFMFSCHGISYKSNFYLMNIYANSKIFKLIKVA